MVGKSDRIENFILYKHGNPIKFTYFIKIEKLFYLKAVRRTNNYYKSVQVIE